MNIFSSKIREWKDSKEKRRKKKKTEREKNENPEAREKNQKKIGPLTIEDRQKKEDIDRRKEI